MLQIRISFLKKESVIYRTYFFEKEFESVQGMLFEKLLININTE